MRRSSSPRRRTATQGFLAALGGALALLVTACSTPTPSRTELADALEDSGIPADVARCTAEAITESFDEDQLAQIVERGPSGAPADDPDRTDDPADRVRDALAVCRAQLPTTTLPLATTLPVVTTPPEQGSGGGSAVSPSSNRPAFDTVPSTAAP